MNHDPQLQALLAKYPDPREVRAQPDHAAMDDTMSFTYAPRIPFGPTPAMRDAEAEHDFRADDKAAELRAEFVEKMIAGRGDVEYPAPFDALGVASQTISEAVDDLVGDLWCDRPDDIRRLQLALIGSNLPAAKELRTLLADAWMAKNGDKLARRETL